MVQAAVPVVRSHRRVESAERWQNALARAIANELEVFTVADSGERMVTSASKLDTLHRTDGHSCTCEAALAGDPVCAHRAAVRFCLGWLTIPDPTPDPRDNPATRCGWCHGNGEVWYRSFGESLPCEICKGTGIKPDHRLAGEPAVRPVATAA